MLCVGTDAGLFAVAGGTVEPLIEGEIRHVVRTSDDVMVVAADRVLRGSAGAGFREIARADDLRVHCVLPLHGRILVGTSGAHLAEVKDGRVEPLESFDAIPGRGEWYTPWGGPPDVRSLTPVPGGGVLVNVHVGGIWRTPDLETWEQVVETDDDVHQVAAGTDGATVVAAAAVGFGESRDAGASWEWTAAGLHASYCRAAALAGGEGDVRFVSSSTGPSTDHAALYRKGSRDRAFTRCDVGLPAVFRHNIDTHCLTAAGDQVAIGTADGEVYVSGDAGDTWDLGAAGLPRVRCVAI